jgi:hypothetical protein
MILLSKFFAVSDKWQGSGIMTNPVVDPFNALLGALRTIAELITVGLAAAAILFVLSVLVSTFILKGAK